MKIKNFILFIIINCNLQLFSMIKNNPNDSIMKTLKNNKKSFSIIGVGPWSNLNGKFNQNDSTVILQDEKTLSEITFTDVITFFIISNNAIMENPIVKEKELVFFAKAKNPRLYTHFFRNRQREYIAFWGKIKFEKLKN